MSTTTYLRNAKEIAAAAKAAKSLGYTTSATDIRTNDRYVMNIVSRLAGADGSEQCKLEQAIVDAVGQVRR